jgi:hypothetical protein
MKFHQIKSPIGLASFGAFFVPEPLGICLVVASALWWAVRIMQFKPVSVLASPLVPAPNSAIDNLILYALSAVAAVAFIFAFCATYAAHQLPH